MNWFGVECGVVVVFFEGCGDLFCFVLVFIYVILCEKMVVGDCLFVGGIGGSCYW